MTKAKNVFTYIDICKNMVTNIGIMKQHSVHVKWSILSSRWYEIANNNVDIILITRLIIETIVNRISLLDTEKLSSLGSEFNVSKISLTRSFNVESVSVAAGSMFAIFKLLSFVCTNFICNS